MWADGIEVASPALDHDLSLLQRIEDFPVQQLVMYGVHYLVEHGFRESLRTSVTNSAPSVNRNYGRSTAMGSIVSQVSNVPPVRLAKALPDGLPFEAVWVMSLQGVFEGAYTYGVTWLHLGFGNAPTWTVRIAPDFDVLDG